MDEQSDQGRGADDRRPVQHGNIATAYRPDDIRRRIERISGTTPASAAHAPTTAQSHAQAEALCNADQGARPIPARPLHGGLLISEADTGLAGLPPAGCAHLTEPTCFHDAEQRHRPDGRGQGLGSRKLTASGVSGPLHSRRRCRWRGAPATGKMPPPRAAASGARVFFCRRCSSEPPWSAEPQVTPHRRVRFPHERVGCGNRPAPFAAL